jgi:hypothetical protein
MRHPPRPTSCSSKSRSVIALCESSGVTPQSALRGMAAMVCGLRYDEYNRLLPLEDATISPSR